MLLRNTLSPRFVLRRLGTHGESPGLSFLHYSSELSASLLVPPKGLPSTTLAASGVKSAATSHSHQRRHDFARTTRTGPRWESYIEQCALTRNETCRNYSWQSSLNPNRMRIEAFYALNYS